MSSTAIMPARAPASMAMLHTVMRPSIDSARIAAAGEFDGVAGAACGADLADDRPARYPWRSRRARSAPSTCTSIVFDFLGQQRLRRQHMLDFGGADAVRQAAERAVGGGMRVAAHHRHAGQRRALLRADHMDDALALVAHAEIGRAPYCVDVGVQRFDLQARDRVGDAVAAVGGRHVVVGHGQIGGDAPRLAPGQLQALERLRAGHFVHQMAVDIQNSGAVVAGMDHMRIPEFVVERLSHRSKERQSAQVKEMN